MAARLPAGFEALESFVPRFAVAGMARRAQLRADAPAAERDAFYAAGKDLIAPALDLLDGKPLDALDDREQRLLELALSFGHIALAIEIQGPDEDGHAQLRQFMHITHSPADARNGADHD